MPMPKYDKKFVAAVERVMHYLQFNIGEAAEGLPLTLKDAYREHTISAKLATEIAEGSEDVEGTEDQPLDAAIAENAIRLMEVVRDDVDAVIAALYDYSQEKADAAEARLSGQTEG